MNIINYNRQSLIYKILRDRYNIFTKENLYHKHFTELNNIVRNNYNRVIEDAEEEYEY